METRRAREHRQCPTRVVSVLRGQEAQRQAAVELAQHRREAHREWHTVDQKQINLFADATGDHQFIHVDPEKSAELSTVYGKGSGDRLKTRAGKLLQEYYGSLFDSRDQPARGLGEPSATLKYNPVYNKNSKI